MRPRGEPGIDDDRRSDSMRQNREDINNRSPNPTILEQDRLDTKENQRPRTWPKSLARNRPRLEGEACAPRSEALSDARRIFRATRFWRVGPWRAVSGGDVVASGERISEALRSGRSASDGRTRLCQSRVQRRPAPTSCVTLTLDSSRVASSLRPSSGMLAIWTNVKGPGTRPGCSRTKRP